MEAYVRPTANLPSWRHFCLEKNAFSRLFLRAETLLCFLIDIKWLQ